VRPNSPQQAAPDLSGVAVGGDVIVPKAFLSACINAIEIFHFIQCHSS
jgi:hypothetical protein